MVFQIVCVEDCAADAELLKRAMQQMLPEAELLHFRNAEAAKEFFTAANARAQREVRLAVVDIQLPGMRGDKFISWLRQQPGFGRLPIIAVSGGEAFKSKEEARAAGASTFLRKPEGYNGYIDLAYHIQEECEAAE